MSDASADVAEAIRLLKGLDFVMGRVDKAFTKTTKEAVVCLERARSSLGAGPAPQAAAALEPSIVEWLYSAADAALSYPDQPAANPADAEGASKIEVFHGALLSIREWAARQLPPERRPKAPAGGLEPLQLR